MTIFKQWDSRWGNLAYPRKPKTLASSGCGCCSIANLLIETSKYENYTPKTVRPYMVKQGYAVYGHGTSWSGITKTLEHYGFKVVEPNISSSMTKAWAELDKGNRMGVLLFRGGTKGGVTWTLGGHYVAFSSYKVKNGKHYFYTKDSGRNNDGWHCYETTMAGLLPKIWIIEKPKETYPQPKRTKGYKGTLPTKTIKYGNTGTQVKRWQLFLQWVYDSKLPKSGGHFKKITDRNTRYFQKANGLVADGIVGPKTLAKAKTFK